MWLSVPMDHFPFLLKNSFNGKMPSPKFPSVEGQRTTLHPAVVIYGVSDISEACDTLA